MSDKTKNEKLIAVVLIMALLVILLPRLKKGSGKIVVDKLSQVISMQPAPVVTEVREADKEELLLSTEYAVQDKRDPLGVPEAFKTTITRALSAKEEEIVLPTLAVSGVVWGSPTPQVIINGKILKEGDIIEEAEILEIEKDGIILLYEGREFSVTVSRPVVSQINQPER